jgi:hypothetical protein
MPLAGCLHSGDVLGQARRCGSAAPDIQSTRRDTLACLLSCGKPTPRAHIVILVRAPCVPRQVTQLRGMTHKHPSRHHAHSIPARGILVRAPRVPVPRGPRDPPAITNRSSPDRVLHASHLTRVTIRSFARRYYDSSVPSAENTFYELPPTAVPISTDSVEPFEGATGHSGPGRRQSALIG